MGPSRGQRGDGSVADGTGSDTERQIVAIVSAAENSAFLPIGSHGFVRLSELRENSIGGRQSLAQVNGA